MPSFPLPLTLLILTLLTPLPTSASVAIVVPDSAIHLMPHNTLFARQVSNLQTFNGSLGGPAAAITNSGDPKRPFEVDGSTFTDFQSAAQRTCDNQANTCSNAANAAGNKGGFTVSDCNTQKTACESAQASATTQSFVTVQSQNIGPDPQFPDFDLICD
ncbi:hypothetical protein K432DRAFT_325301, partial [Lepidopterella palustris CBS 459.81]